MLPMHDEKAIQVKNESQTLANTKEAKWSKRPDMLNKSITLTIYNIPSCDPNCYKTKPFLKIIIFPSPNDSNPLLYETFALLQRLMHSS